MKKHVTTRKKKTLTPQWVHDPGFEVAPMPPQPAGARLPKDYTILISGRKAGGHLAPVSAAAKTSA